MSVIGFINYESVWAVTGSAASFFLQAVRSKVKKNLKDFQMELLKQRHSVLFG